MTMLRWCFWAGAWFDSGYMFQRTVEVPLSVHRQSGGHCSYLQRQIRTVHFVQGRRLQCHGAEDVSLGLVQQTTEIPQLQFIDQVLMSSLRRSSRFVGSCGIQSISHSCSSYSPGQVVARPLCATIVAYGRRSSVQSVVNVPVIHA